MIIHDDRIRHPLSCATFKRLTPTLRVKTMCPFTDGPAIIFPRFDQIHFLHHGLTHIRNEETRNIERKAIWIAKPICIDLGAASNPVSEGVVRGDQIFFFRISYPVDIDAENFPKQRKWILCKLSRFACRVMDAVTCRDVQISIWTKSQMTSFIVVAGLIHCKDNALGSWLSLIRIISRNRKLGDVGGVIPFVWR